LGDLGICCPRKLAAKPGDSRDEDVDRLQDLTERFERFERTQKDMQKEMRQLRNDIREVKSAQISLAVGTNQQSVRIMEHHSLMLVEISRLLCGAGISTEIDVSSGMYLGATPNKSAMSLEDLAKQWPRLFDTDANIGQLSPPNDQSPGQESRTPIRAGESGGIQGVIDSAPSATGSNVGGNHETSEVPGPILHNDPPAPKGGYDCQSSPVSSGPGLQDVQGIQSAPVTSLTATPQGIYPSQDPARSPVPDEASPAHAVAPDSIAPAHELTKVGGATESFLSNLHEVSRADGPLTLSPIAEQKEVESDSMDIDLSPAAVEQSNIISAVLDIPPPILPQSMPTQVKTSVTTGNPPPEPCASLPLLLAHPVVEKPGLPMSPVVDQAAARVASPPAIQLSRQSRTWPLDQRCKHWS
jgi:hypothetical protein